MKVKVFALAILVLLGTGWVARAAKAPARPFYVPRAVSIDGAEIPQGMYQLTVEENKAGVHVQLWKDGRFVASGHGAWVKSGVKYKENAVLLRVNPDGSRSLIEIRLAGASRSIVLSGADAKIEASAK